MIILQETEYYSTFRAEDGNYYAQINDTVFPLVFGPQSPVPSSAVSESVDF